MGYVPSLEKWYIKEYIIITIFMEQYKTCVIFIFYFLDKPLFQSNGLTGK